MPTVVAPMARTRILYGPGAMDPGISHRYRPLLGTLPTMSVTKVPSFQSMILTLGWVTPADVQTMS